MWMMRLPEGVRFADEDAITPTVRLGRTPLIVALMRSGRSCKPLQLVRRAALTHP